VSHRHDGDDGQDREDTRPSPGAGCRGFGQPTAS
jgi:hypothetical protein